MAEADSLDALQGLHQDLLAFRDNRLHDIDRLVDELKSRIEEFRGLLDRKPKNNESRQKLGQSRHRPIEVRYYYTFISLTRHH
jgi:nuclear pore complex protein Nup205